MLATLVSGYLGPRWSSLLGVAVQLPGFIILALLPNPADPLLVMFAYGLLGFGGYFLFVNTFHFALLFPRNYVLADAIIASLFNLSGCVLLLLNIDSLSFKTFFRSYLVVVVLVACVILTIFPDKPYSRGDDAHISQPTLKLLGSQRSFSSVRSCLNLFTNARFVLFAFQFALSCAFSTYLLGLVAQPIYDYGQAHDWYGKWAFPIVTNAVFVWSGVITKVINKTGFGIVSLALAVLCTVATVLCFLKGSYAAAFVNLVVLNVVQGLQYTIEFVFLHTYLPEEAFTSGLTIVLVVQGLFQLLPWPIFEEVVGEHYEVALWVLLVGSVALYAFPALEFHRFGVSKSVCTSIDDKKSAQRDMTSVAVDI